MIKENNFLRIGTIIGVHGLKGRLKIFIITDILERFNPGNKILIKTAGQYREYLVKEFIHMPGKVSLLQLEGISNREELILLKGCEIFIEKSNAENAREVLDPDQFFFYEIIGSNVYWKGDYFGEVVDIILAGESDVLIIKDNTGKEYLIPFVESMVDTKHISKGIIEINPIIGLID
ncbi:MAG: ribosome maturation factor RimM [Spirochaetota bacterium]|nr:ribosome maturation factor RimM [Spirochaetota bacterium]